ncbi:MAG TPA: hypothetical protein EYP43_03830 [Thermoplasmata archaeon]|nr:hypothetical protein [Thermoplasmata archaeon]
MDPTIKRHVDGHCGGRSPDVIPDIDETNNTASVSARTVERAPAEADTPLPTPAPSSPALMASTDAFLPRHRTR